MHCPWPTYSQSYCRQHTTQTIHLILIGTTALEDVHDIALTAPMQQHQEKPRWPPLSGHWKLRQKKINKKHPPIVFACFHLFSLLFDYVCIFLLVFTLFVPSASDRFWPSVFVLCRTICLLPFRYPETHMHMWCVYIYIYMYFFFFLSLSLSLSLALEGPLAWSSNRPGLNRGHPIARNGGVSLK